MLDCTDLISMTNIGSISDKSASTLPVWDSPSNTAGGDTIVANQYSLFEGNYLMQLF